MPAEPEDQHDCSPLSVAICIGTYNQAQYLRGSIESAIAQTYPIQEFWVSDDASTDNTDEVMQQLCGEYPQIRYYRQPKNLALPGNLSWLLAELMRQYPRAGFAHCDVGELDKDNQRLRVRRLSRTATYESGDEMLRSNASGYRTAANCILYRAAAIREVNYYIPNLDWRTCEDWDMVLRMAAAGWGNVYAPRVLSNYRVWEDVQGVRAGRKMNEVMTNIAIYKRTLTPEYKKRGWSTGPLERQMRLRASRFADALDSPMFTAEDRVKYKALLRELGPSPQLTLAIAMADSGLNPLVRWWFRTKIRVKDAVKVMLRTMRSKDQPAHS